jgi:hypothetical protein
MGNGGQVSAVDRHRVVRFRVYVLRDPRDGSVFWVGRCAEGAEITIDRGGSPVEQAAAHQRLSAICAEGVLPEPVVLVDGLTTEAEAVVVERAVRAAYQAGQPASNSLVGAAHSASTLPDGEHPARGDATPTSLTTGFLDDGHRQRLEALILQQDAEISALQGSLDRVRAVRDLAQWAAKIANEDQEGSVKTSDLNNALG